MKTKVFCVNFFSGRDKNRPSVWKRFMTIYTCLLPIVVLIVIVCYFLSNACVTFESIDALAVVLYLLSVFVSVFLIPFILIILIGILIYDHFKQKSSVNKGIVNSRKNSQKSTLSRVCNQFHDSFIGEVIHIFIYFVMIGIIPQVDIILLNLQGIDIHSSFLVKGYDCLLFYPWIVTYVILAIVIYVLIHRLVLQNRKYKRQKAKRKEALERIRNNRQDNTPQPPEE